MFKATFASTLSPDLMCIGQGTVSAAAHSAARDSGILHVDELPGPEGTAAGPFKCLAAVSLAHFLQFPLGDLSLHTPSSALWPVCRPELQARDVETPWGWPVLLLGQVWD